MPNGDIYECTLDSDYASQACANVFHFVQEGTDGTTISPHEAIANIFNANMLPLLQAIIVNTVSLLQYRVRQIKPTQTQQQAFPIQLPGDIAFNGLPPNQCAIARLYATPAGRKGIGYTKIFGVPTDQVNEGRVSFAYANLVKAYADAFEDPYTDAGSGWTMHAAVYSRIDEVARPVVQGGSTGRIKTCYSRSAGVGQ